MASSEVLRARAHPRLDPGCRSALVLIPLAPLSRSFPTRDAVSVLQSVSAAACSEGDVLVEMNAFVLLFN